MIVNSCNIPAKTFFLGEYAALQSYPAILLTTSPCFKVKKLEQKILDNIHSNSPAGKLWNDHLSSHFGVEFIDPYHNLGGLGASTAQFIGVYLLWRNQRPDEVDKSHFYSTYLKYAWSGQGVIPSGYDAIAQLSGSYLGGNYNKSTLYLIKKNNYPDVLDLVSFNQEFKFTYAKINIMLLHTGLKCPTHEHLLKLELNNSLDSLQNLVLQSWDTIQKKSNDMDLLINSVNTYYDILCSLGLVALHTQKLVTQMRNWDGVLAVKGCGALGSDIVLVIVASNYIQKILNKINSNSLQLLYLGA